MSYHVAYSSAQPGSFAHVPGTYVSQVVRHVSDAAEFKVTLLVFYLLSGTREYPGHVTRSDVMMKASSLLGMDEPECAAGLEAAVGRGVFLTSSLAAEAGGGVAYFANIEADLEAIEQFKAGTRQGHRDAASVENIFALYEENIGIITPIIAEELRDAQRTYPAEWIEDAFREAVKGQKRNWKYISRILERWRVEGRGSGTNRPGALPSDPDRYVKGRYGRVVKR